MRLASVNCKSVIIGSAHVFSLSTLLGFIFESSIQVAADMPFSCSRSLACLHPSGAMLVLADGVEEYFLLELFVHENLRLLILQ